MWRLSALPARIRVFLFPWLADFRLCHVADEHISHKHSCTILKNWPGIEMENSQPGIPEMLIPKHTCRTFVAYIFIPLQKLKCWTITVVLKNKSHSGFLRRVFLYQCCKHFVLSIKYNYSTLDIKGGQKRSIKGSYAYCWRGQNDFIHVKHYVLYTFPIGSRVWI